MRTKQTESLPVDFPAALKKILKNSSSYFYTSCMKPQTSSIGILLMYAHPHLFMSLYIIRAGTSSVRDAVLPLLAIHVQ